MNTINSSHTNCPHPGLVSDPQVRIAVADYYLSQRTGRYEWRCERYDAAIDAMKALGLDDSSTVFDVGAGWTEFGARMVEHGVKCRYVPVDACIDGVNLDTWTPPRSAEFFVALELLEHLADPERMIRALKNHATKAVIISTPNPATVDVMAMDATHMWEIYKCMLDSWGFKAEPCSFYGNHEDSLFGVWVRT